MRLHADDETIATILDLMNDRGEEDEVDALSARQHPYEFRVANLAEVFGALTHRHRIPSRGKRPRRGTKQLPQASPKGRPISAASCSGFACWARAT